MVKFSDIRNFNGVKKRRTKFQRLHIMSATDSVYAEMFSRNKLWWFFYHSDGGCFEKASQKCSLTLIHSLVQHVATKWELCTKKNAFWTPFMQTRKTEQIDSHDHKNNRDSVLKLQSFSFVVTLHHITLFFLAMVVLVQQLADSYTHWRC